MSSKPRLIAVAGAKSGMASGPKSLPKVFDRRAADRAGGRLRGFRPVSSVSRAIPVATVTRAEAIDRWVALILRHCGTRERCAAMFGVTFQTACNWFDGVSAPSARAVLQAVDWGLVDAAARRAA